MVGKRYTLRKNGEILTGGENTGKIFHRFLNNEVEVLIIKKNDNILFMRTETEQDPLRFIFIYSRLLEQTN